MTVVMDPAAQFAALYGTNDTFVVTDEKTRIVYEQRYASVSAIRQAIETELGD